MQQKNAEQSVAVKQNPRTVLDHVERIARAKVEQHSLTMLFAQTQPYREWQSQELQALAVQGAFEELTGIPFAPGAQVRDAFLEAKASRWLELKCANSYWFWAVLARASAVAEVLPLTLENLEMAAKELSHECERILQTSADCDSADCDHEHPELLPALRQACECNMLHSASRFSQDGVASGVLLLAPKSTSACERNRFQSSRGADCLRVVMNPLFD
jgi:hypothetical protein